jgi:uncharacterized protein (DUF2384 family)
MTKKQIIKELINTTNLSKQLVESIVSYTISQYNPATEDNIIQEPLAAYSSVSHTTAGEAVSDHHNPNVMLSQETITPIKSLFAYNTKSLLEELLHNQNIGPKFLAERVFEMTQNTFRLYRNDDTKELAPRQKEIGFALLEIFTRGKELFGSKEAFEKWLNQGQHAFGDVAPVNYISTMTGIQLINEELIRIEFGATA